MLYNRVSTLGMTRRMTGALGDLQLQKLKVNEEIASGVHFDTAASLGAQTGRDVALRGLLDETEQYIKDCSVLDGRMTSMDSALTAILTSGQGLLATASTGLGSPSPTGSSLQINARGVLEQITGLLNASSGDGYLFSGIETKTPPMREVSGDASGLPSPISIIQATITTATGGSAMPTDATQAAAVITALDDQFAVRDPALPLPATIAQAFEGALYKGASELQSGGTANPRVSAKVENNGVVEYGVQANDPSIRSLLEGLYMLASVDTSKMELTAYKPYVDAAVSRVSQGLDGIRQATANLGVQRARIDDASERHQVQRKILNGQISDLETVDPTEASVRLQQIEAQLEAAAAATAKLSSFSLTNYI